MAPQRRETGREGGKGSPSGEAVAFLILGGVVTGLGVGAGLDWLLRTWPWCTVIGVFAGFALALYALYLETKPR